MSVKWLAKAFVQKAISFLPKKDKINYLLQKYITKGVYLTDEYFGYKIEHASDHLKFFNKYSDKNFNESIVLELGTGWYPIIPIAFYLNDFNKIYSIDIQPWLNKEKLIITIQHFINWKNDGKLLKFLPSINETKWKKLVNLYQNQNEYSIQSICNELNLITSIDDARNTNFNDNFFDFICSNNTFEHIPKKILTEILIEFKRILNNEGVMSHFIDMSDHFAHFDKNITIYNFLKYSAKTWNLIDNDIQPQNRMRFVDYKSIYNKINLPISYEEFREGNVEEINLIKIHKEFSKYTPKELAISHCYLVSKL